MPAATEHANLHACELAAALERGAWTSRDLVSACLARIELFEPALGAFAAVFTDSALAQADRCDRERAAGVAHGPLHGIPVVIKDLVDIAGEPTRAGSQLFDGYVAQRTAPLVERLLGAGMIVLGKTQMVELAFGGWGTNAVAGTPQNPWDAHRPRVPGGSSSGTGVAVAAGFAPIGIGTDTGGSVRIPAALCGLVGLKTTVGRVPTDRVVLLSESLDTVGPLSRSVLDAALTFDVLAGTATAGTLADSTVRGMCVGMLGADDLAGVDADVRSAYLNVIARLREMGVEVREFSIDPPFEAFVDKNGTFTSYEGWRTHGRRIEAGRALMDPHVLARFEAGRDVTDEAYAAAVRQRAADQIKMHRQLEGFDAIMTPTTPIVAPPIDEVDEGEHPLSRYTRAVNYFGLCALAVPAALNSAGLPISVQFIGRPNDEALLLQFGHAWERERGRFPAPDLSGFLDR